MDFKFEINLREFRQRSRNFEADSLQICSMTNLFVLLHANPPLEDQPPNLRKITLVQLIPEANLSLTISELPRCACAASPKGRAQAVVRPHSRDVVQGCGQGMWSRDVVQGCGGRDCLWRGPRIGWLCVSCFPWCFPWGSKWQESRAANRHHRGAVCIEPGYGCGIFLRSLRHSGAPEIDGT